MTLYGVMSLHENLVIIQSGKHIFQITEKTQIYNYEILHTTLQIGEISQDYISIFIYYENTIPSSARMTECMYDEECAEGNVLQIMIQTLLEYIQQNYPTITEIEYDDMSSIDCASTTYLKPLTLYNLSIVYNEQTWYEHYFGARQKNQEKHVKYRDRVQSILHDKTIKPVKFIEFIKISHAPANLLDELFEFYRSVETYSDFFHSIPESERCRLLRPWVDEFMRYYLHNWTYKPSAIMDDDDNDEEGVFSNYNWIIPLTVKICDQQKSVFYVPKHIRLHTVYQTDIGVSMDDV
jgi:hypothetical protein